MCFINIFVRKMSHTYIIDLFCGIGGFSCGASSAHNATVVACFDMWKQGLAMHYHNFGPSCDHFLIELGGDVTEFSSTLKNYLNKRRIPFERVHIHASPPCQSFSTLNSHIVRDSISSYDDNRTNVLYWTLDLFQALQPRSWSIEQVPTALKHLVTNRHWVCDNPDVNIYQNCKGNEFGVPTLRARLYICKNSSLKRSSKRKRDDVTVFDTIYKGETTNPFRELSKLLKTTAISIRTETNTMKISVHRDDLLSHEKIRNYCGRRRILYVPTQPEYGNNVTSVHETMHALTGNNKAIYIKYAESTIQENNQKSFQYVNQFFKDKGVKLGITRDGYRANCKTLSGQWRKLRYMNSSERLFIQGFPSSYNLECNSCTLLYFTDLCEMIPIEETVNVKNEDKVQGVGNSVIPVIAKQIIDNIGV